MESSYESYPLFLPPYFLPPCVLLSPVSSSITDPSFTSLFLSALFPSHLLHPTGWWVVVFQEREEPGFLPTPVSTGVTHLLWRQLWFLVGFCLFCYVFSNDLILKWCVCCVFLCFSSLWKSGRLLLKSMSPYIWANLGIKSKYCSNQRTRLPKGLPLQVFSANLEF